MKTTRFLSTTFTIAALLLFGCQASSDTPQTQVSQQTSQTQPTQTTTQTQQSQQQGGGLHIYTVNEDGTSQEITGQVGAGTQQSKPSVLEGVKGIAISDEGFKPNTLTIKVGTKVIFQNIGEKQHWPASDPHPSHTVCPGFDAKKGLAKGETYEFTFTKAQTCGFHDHLNPSLKGKIVVEE